MTRTRAKCGLLALAFGFSPGCAVSAASPYETNEGGVNRPPRDDDASTSARDAGDEVDASGPAKSDGGDAETDAGAAADAGPTLPDAAMPQVDAGPQPDAGAQPDAGPSDSGMPAVAPKIDGVIEAGEWTNATRVTQSEPTNWGIGKNQFSDLHAKVHSGRLYVALQGTVEPQNALILYVDAQGTAGHAPKDLKDDTGALDNAISAALTVPSNFKADFAFGVRTMGKWGAGLDDTMGWRDVRDATDFAWLDSAKDAPCVCSLNACETSIALETLLPTGSTMLMFARIVTATGDGASNQTLPYDAPSTPMNVSNVLTIKVGN